MKWLDRLEKKYHKYAIPNLIQYVVGGMAMVFIFGLINPSILDFLSFSPKLVMEGQIWRVFTFIFLPRTKSLLWIIFSLLFFLFAGRTIEQYWGAFRFNVYYLVGTLGTIVAGIIVEALYGGMIAIPLTNYYLNMTMLFALAAIIPNFEVRIYFILPVKMKYIGYIFGGLLLWEFLSGPLPQKIIIFASVLNFILFFGPSLINKSKQTYRKQQYRQANKPTPKAKPTAKQGEVIQVAFHCCEVCNKTEVDDPSLEFRYCSKCEGRHEYCTEHILSHTHITED
ncbi:MAG: hypothetical protein CVU98_06855 [Firmicutes bacterium HGW-Firmicutes-3]|jgi:ribosomal protein L37AE/L43A/membrane associated rhomboid family serine protease|nr:MAG: hypothetical protein CVU98_06855 [Firmicutes bacterium HGW-Firmicutes-3]